MEVKVFQPGILNAAEEALGATHIEGWGRGGYEEIGARIPSWSRVSRSLDF